MGQLVAVIAAYRHLPPRIKELIDWDQQRLDVTVKYQQVVTQFGEGRRLPVEEEVTPEALRQLEGPITVDGLRVIDRRGTPLIDGASLTIERPSHVALLGSGGSGRDVLAKVLARQITEYQGAVCLGGRDYTHLNSAVTGRILAYAGAEPLMFAGTIRDNITYSLRRSAPPEVEGTAASSRTDARRQEAILSGNPTASADDDWIDYEAAGAASPEDLDAILVEALRTVGMADDIYRLGLNGKLGPKISEEVCNKLIEARRAVRSELAAQNLTRLVEPFDPNRYNANATIGENLLFGVPLSGALLGSELPADPYVRAILEAEVLLDPP